MQRRVREVYLEAAADDPSLRIVSCADARGSMDTPEEIFRRLRAEIEPLLENGR